MRAVLSVLVLVACSEPVAWEDLEWAPASSQDQGTICLISGTEADVDAVLPTEPFDPQDFQPGEPLLALHGLTYNTHCQREFEVTIEASGLDLSTTATWEEPDPPKSQYILCTQEPGELVITTLALDPLHEGEHTVHYAGESLPLSVPSIDRICLGSFPFGRE